MSTVTRNRKFHWLGATAVAALGLAAVSVPLAPAHAQIGVQIGPVGVGVGPYYGPGYYYPYHHHYYYGPGYYAPYGW